MHTIALSLLLLTPLPPEAERYGPVHEEIQAGAGYYWQPVYIDLVIQGYYLRNGRDLVGWLDRKGDLWELKKSTDGARWVWIEKCTPPIDKPRPPRRVNRAEK